MKVATNTATLISVEEYLGRSYDPNTEYIDGVLRPKPMPTRLHGKMENHATNLINWLDLGFEAVPEQTVRMGDMKCLIPDVAVQDLRDLQDPYPIKPIHLCIEVVSPDDRFRDLVSKCEEYHAWGVRYCWIIDPQQKRAWQYESGDRPSEILAGGQITAGPIVLNIDDLFAGF